MAKVKRPIEKFNYSALSGHGYICLQVKSKSRLSSCALRFNFVTDLAKER